MISFFAGLYIGGAIVDFLTNLFLAMTPREAAIGAAIWPYSAIKTTYQLVLRESD